MQIKIRCSAHYPGDALYQFIPMDVAAALIPGSEHNLNSASDVLADMLVGMQVGEEVTLTVPDNIGEATFFFDDDDEEPDTDFNGDEPAKR